MEAAFTWKPRGWGGDDAVQRFPGPLVPFFLFSSTALLPFRRDRPVFAARFLPPTKPLLEKLLNVTAVLVLDRRGGEGIDTKWHFLFKQPFITGSLLLLIIVITSYTMP